MPQPPNGREELLARLRNALADRYRVERELGRGGMATVFLAQDLRHDRPVAIKVLHPELASSIGTHRFLQEIRTAAQLVHPHILAMHDSGEADGLLYYTMPYVEGESLAHRIEREGRLTIEESVRITREIGEALGYAHERGVVHRDIKPGNILLVNGRHVAIADFGLARALATSESQRLTASGIALGSPLYMAPEQISAAKEIDGRSDLYSLGCLTFEMLIGRPPFEGHTLQSVLAQHLTKDPPEPRSLRKDIPFELSALIQKALAKDPAKRYLNATELVSALPSTSQRSPSIRSMLRSRRLLVRTAVLLIFLLIGSFVAVPRAMTSLSVRLGIAALGEWRLEAAESHFHSALRRNPENARAGLWLAQTMTWQGDDLSNISSVLQQAMEDSASLAESDLEIAHALAALARADFPVACRAYETMIASDSTSFLAWLGLAECHRRDGTVLVDSSSPSGYRFRSSRNLAVNSYARAFRLLPDIHRGLAEGGLGRIRELLFTSTRHLAVGRTDEPTVLFLAYPSWGDDSLEFIPFPASDFADAKPHTIPRTLFTAVREQREVLRSLSGDWLAESVNSPGALEAFSISLELLGDAAALDTLRRARTLATEPSQQLRLAATEVWQRVRFGAPDDLLSLERARILADSLLLEPRELTEPEALQVGSLAGLVGRLAIAARLARRVPNEVNGVGDFSASIATPAAALLSFAAFGVPDDSIRPLAQFVETAIRNNLPRDEQPMARQLLLGRAASLSYSTNRLEGHEGIPVNGDYLLTAQLAHLRGDTLGVRRVFDQLRELRVSLRPADRGFDALLPEASLLQAIGTPRDAIEWLDPTLTELRWVESQSIERVSPAAAFVRSMELRAKLASEVGDSAGARRWAAAVVALWGDADPPLQPSVIAMRTLSRNP